MSRAVIGATDLVVIGLAATLGGIAALFSLWLMGIEQRSILVGILLVLIVAALTTGAVWLVSTGNSPSGHRRQTSTLWPAHSTALRPRSDRPAESFNWTTPAGSPTDCCRGGTNRVPEDDATIALRGRSGHRTPTAELGVTLIPVADPSEPPVGDGGDGASDARALPSGSETLPWRTPDMVRHMVQCPNCADFRVDVRRRPTPFQFTCLACGHSWQWWVGKPWPVTVARPRARRDATPN